MLDASAQEIKLRYTAAFTSIILSLLATSSESRFASHPLLHYAFVIRFRGLNPLENKCASTGWGINGLYVFLNTFGPNPAPKRYELLYIWFISFV